MRAALNRRSEGVELSRFFFRDVRFYIAKRYEAGLNMRSEGGNSHDFV